MSQADLPVLEGEGLERAFGTLRVLRGIDLAILRGQALVVFGPNGAGKTTLLKILAGLMRPTAGTVRVMGNPVRAQEPETRRPIGLLSHQTLLYDDLTPLENLMFAARLYGLADPRGTSLQALEALAVSARATDPLRELSRGTVQRVAIARSLLHDPSIVLLDEPFTGLDVVGAELFRGVLAGELGRGRTIVLVTHQLAEVWELATHIGVLLDGRWALYEERPADLGDFLPRYGELLRG
ncbi:MAG: heme ABC exporter ATP-binding protein CcmA [Gemmatimonadales bacterium]|nr:heme ABC exporter ATP-binding protein CcmA [Gemmatimonadales bacterium]